MEIKKDSQAPENEEVKVDVQPKSEEQPKEEAPKDEGIDYKSELEKVSKKLGQAEHTIVKLKKSKKEEEEDEEEESEEEDVDTKINTQLSEMESRLLADRRNELIEKVAKNEDEAKLINWYMENKIKSSGNLSEDVKLAKLLANRNVIEKNMEALSETLKEKGSFNGSGGSGSQGVKEKADIALSDADRRVMKAFGVSEDELD